MIFGYFFHYDKHDIEFIEKDEKNREKRGDYDGNNGLEV